MAKDFFRQCRLELRSPGKVSSQVSWLPEKYAVKGKYLELKNEEGEWVNGWQVMDIYARFEASKVRERSQDYKRTRKASDV